MSLQQILNNEAFDYVPRVNKLIKQAKSFEANQMYNKALRMFSNCTPCLAEMTDAQRDSFEWILIDMFKDNGWITQDNLNTLNN